MIYTARQVEQLHKSNGHVTLPYRARMTPMAQDWVKSKGIRVGYADEPAPRTNPPKDCCDGCRHGAKKCCGESGVEKATVLFWCDGSCGVAKAALSAEARESKAAVVELPPGNLIPAVRQIASDISAGRASAAVLFVKTGAAALVFANRCPSLRAVLGTSLDAVEQGIALVAANVLVVEHPHKTLPQVKSMLARFFRGNTQASEALLRDLKELSSCV